MPGSPFEVITPNKEKKGKTGLIIAVVVIVFLIVSVVIGVILVKQNQNVNERAVDNTIPTTRPNNTLAITNTYTAAQIATHNTSSNCWLIINNNVYDVSTYLVQHPGGVSIVTPYCGKESTQAFNTRGGNGSHSNSARNMLTQYLVGTLIASSATASPTPTAVPTATALPTPTPTQAAGVLQCNASCTSSAQCGTGRVCLITSGVNGFCRNSVCTSQSNCTCTGASATPSPTPSPTGTGTSLKTSTPTAVATQKVQTSPLPIPETGTSLPTILGGILGVFVIVGSIILAF